MADPLFPIGSPGTVDGSRWKLIGTAIAALGVICGLAAVLFANAPAGAMGGGNPAAVMLRADEAPSRPITNQGNPEFRSRPRAPTNVSQSGLAVCVRLCDGYFFPSNGPSSHDEDCAAQCPDAPTALFREPAGSDRIEDAVSTKGTLYSELPVAGRHRTAYDTACTCHSHNIDYSAMLLHDPTLRKGDVVMTPKGPVVYEGRQTQTPRREDFVALSRDSTLPRDTRAALSTMRSAAWAADADRLSAR